MKIDIDTLVAAPRSRVIELLDDPANLVKWQPNLLRFEPISGKPGAVGSKSRLVYKSGKGEFEMIETITDNKMPDEFTADYATSMGVTRIRNRYLEAGEKTRWVMESNYTPSGAMKLFAFLLKGVIRKETMKFVDAFKRFAESQPS